jgi:hypothetical protein
MEEESLHELYYSAATGLSSATKLYERAKKAGLRVTKQQVKDFVERQETDQVYRKPKVKHYYPLLAYSPFSRVQIDLADVHQVAHWNSGVKFLFCAVDVQSRFAFVLPLKDKGDGEVLRAFTAIVEKIMEMHTFPPSELDSDQEASFMSRQFRKYCKERNIHQRFAPIEDYKATAVVERFIQTLRELIGRYLTAHHTQRYVDALGELVENYNTRINGGIGSTPEEMAKGEAGTEQRYWKLRRTEITKARGDKVHIRAAVLKVGDRVRVLLRRGAFTKGTAAKWSRDLHNIEREENGLFFVSGRVAGYKGYELQLASVVDALPVRAEEQKELEEEKEEVEGRRRLQRGLNREGIAEGNVREGRPARNRRQVDTGFSLRY